MTEEEFDLAGDLPEGRWAIEASAGTGKTFTLASLAARYVAQGNGGNGVPIDEIVVVTFARAAAAELRERVRDRMHGLVAALGDDREDGSDPVLACLRRDDPTTARERLARALADFDRATITTIHGFAQQVRATLGSHLPGDPAARLAEDTDDLVKEVATDFVARAALTSAAVPPGSVEALVAYARPLLRDPEVTLVEPKEPHALVRADVVADVAAEVRRRRRRQGTVAFDDLLVELREALRSGDAVRAIRRRFRVALVDEFQDTDVPQWEALRAAFGVDEPGRALVLVGDPKQAIYGFRGADVRSYERAVHEPGMRAARLATDYRADGQLVRALNGLFARATFGGEAIGFRSVRPAADHDAAMIVIGAEPRPGFEVRVLPATRLVDDQRHRIAVDLAATVADLLDRATLPARDGHAARSLEPDDVAVLIRANREGPVLQEALRAFGVPAVVVRGASVLATPAAAQLRTLVGAIADPTDPAHARAAALTWFFRHTAADVAAMSEADLAAMQRRLGEWSRVLEMDGLAWFWRVVESESDVLTRLLATVAGERHATDLEQIVALLRSLPTSRTHSAALVAGELDRAARSSPRPDDDATAREIESDAPSVRIMTMHEAKGLEFPVVCVPSMWTKGGRSVRPRHTEDGGRELRIGEKDADVEGEDARLLYVALTRGRHLTVAWWAALRGNGGAPMSRLLFGRDDDGLLPRALTGPAPRIPADAAAPLVPACVGVVDVDALAPRAAREFPPPSQLTLELAVAHRAPPTRRRWSFSAITALSSHGAEDPRDASLGDAGAADERSDDSGDLRDVERSDLPLGGLPGGTEFGTLVHALVGDVDFTDVRLESSLHAAALRRLGKSPLAPRAEELAAGLAAALATPLGPVAGGAALCGIGRADRLDEVTFELHLGAGGSPPRRSEIGELVGAHASECPEPILRWAERAATTLDDAVLDGHLTGAIDLVARVDGERFVLADYKTNVLGDRMRGPRAEDYEPARLGTAMAESDYVLQAVIYSVALHRYLRGRLRDYDPDRHFGGTAYLFVRGMTGPSTPVHDGSPNGVFAWRPPTRLIEALSALFDGSPR